MFLKNTWYAAGWSSSFDRTLKAERLLGENIVFYRTETGEPVALEDACPHRKLPLSMGTLCGDRVVCGYHGLTFDPLGTCVSAPTQPEHLPAKAKVRSYPVVDRYRLLWIWMGDPDKADPDTIFPIENFDNPQWGYTDGGCMHMKCDFLWMVDNLLDPSHVAWVHLTSFAGAGTDNAPLDVTRTARGVVVSRWIHGQPPSAYYRDLLHFKGPCDRYQYYEMCMPGIGLNKSIYTPAGTGGPGMDAVPETYINISYNFMTPIDEDNTKYIWFQHRNTDPRDSAISEQMNKGAHIAFEEDRVVLEKVHAGMKQKATPNIDLGLDAGARLFRKKLSEAIDREQSR